MRIDIVCSLPPVNGLVTAGPAESEDWVAGLEDGMEEGSVP